MIWLIVLHAIWVLLKGIHFIYLLERKQYRLHRFQSMIHDRGFFILFYSLHIKLPTKSIRNLLIMSFHAMTVIILFLYSFENIYLYDFLAYYFFLAPFVAFAIIITGVILTQIPVSVYQHMVMRYASWLVRRSHAQFVAVTGSYGKSEVVYLLKEILSKKYTVATTEENMNTEMGIAQSILRHLKKDTEIMVIEAATYIRGQIKKETSYIPFDAAILTGIGNQHIDLFSSHDELINEESYLVRTIPSEKPVYVNERIPNKSEVVQKRKNLILYGFSSHSNITCRDYSLTSNNSQARITYKGMSIKIETEMIGKHALLNLLPAIAYAYDHGIPPHEIRQVIRNINRRDGKLSTHRGNAQALFVLNTVNSSVESALNAIDLLRRFPQKNKIFVLAPLTELGGERKASYKKILKAAVKEKLTVYLLRPGHGINEKKHGILIFNDVELLEQSLQSQLNKGTVVVLEGMFPPDFIRSQTAPQ